MRTNTAGRPSHEQDAHDTAENPGANHPSRVVKKGVASHRLIEYEPSAMSHRLCVPVAVLPSRAVSADSIAREAVETPYRERHDACKETNLSPTVVGRCCGVGLCCGDKQEHRPLVTVSRVLVAGGWLLVLPEAPNSMLAKNSGGQNLLVGPGGNAAISPADSGLLSYFELTLHAWRKIETIRTCQRAVL